VVFTLTSFERFVHRSLLNIAIGPKEHSRRTTHLGGLTLYG
jgi:hypothetical protein